jgi:DNA-binding transcriptional MerR regulator
MEYAVQKLAKMAGVSVRTLRYYDEISLLSPLRTSNGYRIYGPKEVDLLQQILIYRELGVPLEKIKEMPSLKDFDRKKALQGHLKALIEKRAQLDLLIANVEKTIGKEEGEMEMKDEEKFKGFINELVDENERVYGSDARSRYGDGEVDRSNEMLRGKSEKEWIELQAVQSELEETLRDAMKSENPDASLYGKAYELHKKWLSFFWEGYSLEAHKGIAQMYLDDPRFTVYYDNIAKGSAVFLRNAVYFSCGAGE